MRVMILKTMVLANLPFHKSQLSFVSHSACQWHDIATDVFVQQRLRDH